jgi:hypothetical protein
MNCQLATRTERGADRAEPICSSLYALALLTCRHDISPTVHDGGVVVRGKSTALLIVSGGGLLLVQYCNDRPGSPC